MYFPFILKYFLNIQNLFERKGQKMEQERIEGGKERGRKGKRERKREGDLPPVGSLRKYLQQPGLGKAAARSQELYLCLQ